MGGAELFFRKIIDPSPAFAVVVACVHACERGHDLPIWFERVDLDAVGPNVGTCLICSSMQKKARVGHPLYAAGTDRVIHSPAGSQMKTSHNTHSMDRRIRAHSINATPFHYMEVEKVSLIASSHIEITWDPLFWDRQTAWREYPFRLEDREDDHLQPTSHPYLCGIG